MTARWADARVTGAGVSAGDCALGRCAGREGWATECGAERGGRTIEDRMVMVMVMVMMM